MRDWHHIREGDADGPVAAVARRTGRLLRPGARQGAHPKAGRRSFLRQAPAVLGPAAAALPADDVAGGEVFELAARLLPIGRSLTGDGVRETLRIVGAGAPLELSEVPSGSAAFDWVVPPEWNIREASITDERGERVVDLDDHPPHVVTDERQFCSPGFDLPVGTLTRTPNGGYPEYHTSADDLGVLVPGKLADTLRALAELLDVLDANRTLVRADPRGEPQLSRHSLDGAMTPGLLGRGDESREALLWTLNLCDGSHSLLDVAERAGLPFALIAGTAEALLAAGLLRESP